MYTISNVCLGFLGHRKVLYGHSTVTISHLLVLKQLVMNKLSYIIENTTNVIRQLKICNNKYLNGLKAKIKCF